MNKSIKNKTIINIIVLYFIYLFFYGIIIKFTIENKYLFTIKTYVPEALLIIVTIISLISTKMKINKNTAGLITYIVLMIILNYFCNGANAQSFYWWRDAFIPLGAAFALMQIDFNEVEKEYFLKKLIRLGKIFLLLGFLLAIVQQMKGYEWSSRFYTGYVFYGQDEYSKVKIAHNVGMLRTPSLTGNFATFAYYSCFSLLIILSRKNKKENIIWILLGLANCILSTNKSAIISIVAVLAIRYTITIRKKNKKINKIFFFMLVVTLLSFMLVNSENVLSSKYTGGFFQRFDVWKDLVQNLNVLQLIIPYEMFLYGSGSEGFNSFFDNLYLYCLITQGAIGMWLWIEYIKNDYKNILMNSKDNIKILTKDLMYFFLIVGLTSNVVQGHAYFSLFLIYLGFFYSFKSSGVLKEKN